MLHWIKRSVKNFLCTRIPNALLRRLLKPFSSRIPNNILSRIPIFGLICLQLPNLKKLYLRTDGNDTIASIIYWKGIEEYEGATIQLFIKLLKLGCTVFDIGANTGIYSLIAAIDNPHRNVYAFEPVPRVLDGLKRNVKINRLRNIQVDSSAITNYDGVITLFIPPGTIPSSSSTLQGFRETCEAVSVPALTIDSFIAKNNISRVDIMKIDTEATEHMVLEGARNTIKRDEPIIICEVLKGRTEKYLHAALDSFGYRYFLISSKGLLEREQIEGDNESKNYLFITNKRIEEFISQKICVCS